MYIYCELLVVCISSYDAALSLIHCTIPQVNFNFIMSSSNKCNDILASTFICSY